jgi:demethylmenaquinone methyltransferase/2-methoxy-6-polyprenyl-1,4-benzoquinol methylase
MKFTAGVDARRLFAPIAPNYERWSRFLSLGQDFRWRSQMVDRLRLPPRANVLDVAAGTGFITRLLQERGHRVISVDYCSEMLQRAAGAGAKTVRARAEWLPFAGSTFDGLTFGYLLRYVADPVACLRELARVVRPDGYIGMVEFGRPAGFWRVPWRIFTRGVLPAAGFTIGHGWHEVGSFLGPSIDRFHDEYPGDGIAETWLSAGLGHVTVARPSLGGGLIVWGRKL